MFWYGFTACYSVDAAQGDVCLCFAELSVNERPKMIETMVMLSSRFYSLKCAF